MCLITLSHYCEKYSSLQLRRLSVCVKQLLTNDNNPSCCIIGKKCEQVTKRKFYLNSNPRDLKIRRVGRSQLPTQAYVTFVYEFTANCEKKTFLGFTFLKDPIKVVKLWSGWYKRGQHNIYIKAAVIRLTCKLIGRKPFFYQSPIGQLTLLLILGK